MKRILIVDSDMAVRGQIGRHARLEGYEVAEAGDGYTAVSMCRQNAFDIIFWLFFYRKWMDFRYVKRFAAFLRFLF